LVLLLGFPGWVLARAAWSKMKRGESRLKLGLAGMQERVQLLGGRLKLESKPSKGTKIFVEAPV